MGAQLKRIQLGSKEIWTLGQWMDQRELTPADTKAGLAAEASEILKREVTENNITNILNTIGTQIPTFKRDVDNGKAVRLLALQLNVVCVSLNIPLVAGFEDLLP